jgi:hypothetical protein
MDNIPSFIPSRSRVSTIQSDEPCWTAAHPGRFFQHLLDVFSPTPDCDHCNWGWRLHLCTL